ncbi:MAG: MFS transporter [Candidatus Eremiobacteraeota bacterium]|nr:MFS transporter [Candidatus Eremiobacteraeota bacterium]
MNRRAAFWPAAAAFVVVMLGTTLPTPLYPLYARAFGFGEILVTIIFAAYALGVIAGLLLFGRLSDEIGRRRVLLPALMLSALSAIAFLLARGVPAMFIGRLLSGLSAGIFTGCATAMLVELADEQHRNVATVLAVAANLGGLALGPLLAGLLAEYASFPLRIPYAVDLALLLPVTLGFLFVPETVANPKRRAYLRLQRIRIPPEIRAVFVRAAIVGCCGFAVAGVFSAVAPSILSSVLHVAGPAAAGTLVFLFLGTAAAGQFAVKALPRRGAFRSACAVLVVGLGLLAWAVAAHSPELLFLSAAVAGFGEGLTVSFGLVQINKRVKERRGEVISSYFVILYLGLIAPVVGLGILSTLIGLSLAAEVFCAVIGATVAGVMLTVAKTSAMEDKHAHPHEHDGVEHEHPHEHLEHEHEHKHASGEVHSHVHRHDEHEHAADGSQNPVHSELHDHED